MTTIKDTIKAFINIKSRYDMNDKKMVLNLFGINDNPSEYSLAMQDCLDLNSDILNSNCKETLELSIKSSVKSYPKNKDNAIMVYKNYIEYLDTKYNIALNIQFPSIPVSVSLERQMYIVKLLHNPDIKISDLSDKLFVSQRTIDDDLRKLKGNDDDPLQVMGQKLVVDFERRLSGVKFPSTVHPLFLTQNLTQIISILSGLKNQMLDPAYEEYATSTATSIWLQLSEYAQNRILEMAEILNIDKNWFKKLDIMSKDDSNSNLFRSELDCSKIEGLGSILNCLKNGKLCFIEYENEDGAILYYKECKILGYRDDKFIIEHQGMNVELNAQGVLKSGLTMQDLI